MKRGLIHFHTGVNCGICGRGEALRAQTVTEAMRELHEMGWHRTTLHGWVCNLCIAKERKAD